MASASLLFCLTASAIGRSRRYLFTKKPGLARPLCQRMSSVAHVADQPSLVSRSLRWVFFLSQREADWNGWSGVWSSLGSKRTPCGKKIPATTVFGCLLCLTSHSKTWIPALSSYREVDGCTRGSEAISLSLEAWWPAPWMSLACEAQASRSGPRVLGFIW
jgi:hypothetical protein